MTAKAEPEKVEKGMTKSTIDIIRAPMHAMQSAGGLNTPKGAVFALKTLACEISKIEPVEDLPPTMLELIAKLG
jgi:hypothetical protein